MLWGGRFLTLSVRSLWICRCRRRRLRSGWGGVRARSGQCALRNGCVACPVPEDKHGTQYAARTYGCRCELCLRAAREHERAWAAQRPMEAKVRKAAQTAARHAAQPDQRNDIRRACSIRVAEITGPQAIRAGEPITDDDIEVACDMSMTVLEAALILGRTASSVCAPCVGIGIGMIPLSGPATGRGPMLN